MKTIDAGRTLAALLGAPLAAYTAMAAAIAFLPIAEEARFALGAHAIVPLWAALVVLLPLARSGWRAWGYCLAVALPCGLALLLRGQP